MKKKRNKNNDCWESNKNNKNKKNDNNDNDRNNDNNNDSGDLIERKKKKKMKRIMNRKISITQHFDISYLAMLLIKLISYYINNKVPTCPRAS